MTSFLCFSVCLSVCISFSVSVSRSLSLYMALCFFLPLSPSVCPSLSLYMALARSLSLCLFLPLAFLGPSSPRLSLCLCLILIPICHTLKLPCFRIPFSERGQHGKSFFPSTLEIHWLSIINSVVLALLLGGVVLIIVVRLPQKYTG